VSAIIWRAGSHSLSCGERTLVMGILNVTPDSFSDGGMFFDPEVAVAHGIRMAEEGADIIDVGAESTRPGSDPVPPEKERDRLVPIVKRLTAELDVPISADTRKAEVAAAAVEAGASIVNDVSAGRDPAMFEIVRDAGAGYVAMHMQGEPKTMQDDPHYDDVVTEVRDFLAERIDAAVAAGIDVDRICVDPGLGFAKNFHHSARLMKEIDQLLSLGRPVLVGPSRKSFIGEALGDAPMDRRLEGTLGAVAWMAARGAHIVRVHDVEPTVRLLSVVDAIRNA
jgi:dihydropteroate synthase